MSPSEWEIVRLSLMVAVTATGVLLPFAILIAWLLARCRFPGLALLDLVVHLPLVLPPVVTGWLLLLLLGRHAWLGTWLETWCGIRIPFTWLGAVVAAAVMALPLLVRPVRLALELADPGLEPAARNLGATPWRAWWTITLPLAIPGIFAGTALAFARCLGEFGATMTLAGNIPGETRTLPVAIWSLTQSVDGEPALWRLVGISLAISVLALVAAEGLSKRWQARRQP
jgi:molybdate transport system permease protein